MGLTLCGLGKINSLTPYLPSDYPPAYGDQNSDYGVEIEVESEHSWGQHAHKESSH